MAAPLKLISHKLCPYVQRAVIALTEKDVSFERIDIDLANKPDWFLKISPLGKTPVLVVGEHAIFESAVILEYLEDTQPHPLYPADPLARAHHRAMIELGSAMLSDIWGLEIAPTRDVAMAKIAALRQKLARLERDLDQRPGNGPWFAGKKSRSKLGRAGWSHECAGRVRGFALAFNSRSGARNRECRPQA